MACVDSNDGTALIGGVDLEDYGCILDMSGVMSEAPSSGEPIVIPGRPGALFVEGVGQAWSFPIPMTLAGTTRGDRLASLAALRALTDTAAGTVTLTRRYYLGDVLTEDSAACIRIGGLIPAYPGPTAIDLVITMMNMDGGWA